MVTPTSIPELVGGISNVSASDRRRGVLSLLGDLTEEPRQYVSRDRIRERWLDLGFVSPEEYGFWTEQLAREGLVSSDSGGFRLTPEGVLACEALGRARRDLTQVFVAMAFGSTASEQTAALDLFDNGLRTGIEGRTTDPTGLRARRIDQVSTNNKLCDEIIVELRRSRAVVADVTYNRPNVYYEAGFAHGLGIPVVFTCDKEKFAPHFDTRQYQTILWTSADDLAHQLETKLRATLL